MLSVFVQSLSTQFDLVTHICIYASVNWISVGPDKGVPAWRLRAVIWTCTVSFPIASNCIIRINNASERVVWKMTDIFFQLIHGTQSHALDRLVYLPQKIPNEVLTGVQHDYAYWRIYGQCIGSTLTLGGYRAKVSPKRFLIVIYQPK